MHTTSGRANRLANICDLNNFIQFLCITGNLTGNRLAGIITTVLMERRWPRCKRTRISQNEKHEREYQDYIEQMTLNLFQLQFQLAAFIITFEGVHQNPWPLPIQRNHKKLVAQAHQLFLQYFLGKPLLSGKGEDKLTCRGKTWQTEMDGDRFLSCQHLCSELSLLFLHFNKLLFSEMLPHRLIGMRRGNVLVSRTT